MTLATIAALSMQFFIFLNAAILLMPTVDCRPQPSERIRAQIGIFMIS